MKVKVCGMKYPENIESIAGLKPDYLGFIFFAGSKRYAGDLSPEKAIVPEGISKVGVFVNAAVEEIESMCGKFGLTHVQLHGEETPEICAELQKKGYTVIKVFSVDEEFDFEKAAPYKKVTDYFLFDTKSESYGGTGKKFNWEIFRRYDNDKPFFLSGGIGPEDTEEIKKLKGLKIHAVDINSRFEESPGLKNADRIRPFMEIIKNI